MNKKRLIYYIYGFIISIAVIAVVAIPVGEIIFAVGIGKSNNEIKKKYYDNIENVTVKLEDNLDKTIKINADSRYKVTDSKLCIFSSDSFEITLEGALFEYLDCQRVFYVDNYYYTVENISSSNYLVKFNKDTITKKKIDDNGKDYLYYDDSLYLINLNDKLNVYKIEDDNFTFMFSDIYSFMGVSSLDINKERVYEYNPSKNNIVKDNKEFTYKFEDDSITFTENAYNGKRYSYTIYNDSQVINDNKKLYYSYSNYFVIFDLSKEKHKKISFDKNIKSVEKYSNIIYLIFEDDSRSSFYI